MQAMWYSRYSKCVSLSRLNGISDFRAQHDCLLHSPYAHAKILVCTCSWSWAAGFFFWFPPSVMYIPDLRKIRLPSSNHDYFQSAPHQRDRAKEMLSRSTLLTAYVCTYHTCTYNTCVLIPRIFPPHLSA